VPNVVRFALPTERDLYVSGLGNFHSGILDVPADDAEMLTRARYLIRPYGAIELGVTDSTTPYPDLPAVGPGDPDPDPYPQYATMEELRAASGTYSGDRTWTGDHEFQGEVDFTAATLLGVETDSVASALGIFMPEDFGAKGDQKLAINAAMTSGSAVLTATGAGFASTDVGKTVVVVGAGAAGGPLVTTISAFTDASTITLGASASTSVTGQDATWGTDDTAALQAAINAAVAARGQVWLSSKTYCFTHLDIPSPCKIKGTGVFGVYGNFPTGNFTPQVAPFLTGSVLKCMTNGQAAAIDILGESATVDLEDFGLLWASPFVSTGHGIRHSPGAGKNGLASPNWRNIQVFGHDGNSYAFYMVNMTLGTFSHLRAWGGGLLRFLQDGGSQYGNATFIGCQVKLLAGGTAHTTHLSSTGSDYTRMGFVGCEWNAVPGKNYAAFARYAFTNPVVAQLMFNCPDGTLRGLSLISPAFDTGGASVGAPVFPHAKNQGGVFIDPGGWYQGNAGAIFPMIESPLGDGIVPMAVNQVFTVTAAATITATTAGNIRLCDATSAAFAVTLPAANVSSGREFIIKKIDASANAVTVTRAGTDTIDGATTYALSTQHAFVTIISDGTAWRIVAKG
jgi:hypothetical protein